MHLVGKRSGSLELFMRSHQTTQSVHGLEVIRRGDEVGVRKSSGGRTFHFCSEAVSRLRTAGPSDQDAFERTTGGEATGTLHPQSPPIPRQQTNREAGMTAGTRTAGRSPVVPSGRLAGKMFRTFKKPSANFRYFPHTVHLNPDPHKRSPQNAIHFVDNRLVVTY
jgi:hypothetical protein